MCSCLLILGFLKISTGQLINRREAETRLMWCTTMTLLLPKNRVESLLNTWSSCWGLLKCSSKAFRSSFLNAEFRIQFLRIIGRICCPTTVSPALWKKGWKWPKFKRYHSMVSIMFGVSMEKQIFSNSIQLITMTTFTRIKICS